jgi:hypothetical protein
MNAAQALDMTAKFFLVIGVGCFCLCAAMCLVLWVAERLWLRQFRDVERPRQAKLPRGVRRRSSWRGYE